MSAKLIALVAVVGAFAVGAIALVEGYAYVGATLVLVGLFATGPLWHWIRNGDSDAAILSAVRGLFAWLWP